MLGVPDDRDDFDVDRFGDFFPSFFSSFWGVEEDSPLAPRFLEALVCP